MKKWTRILAIVLALGMMLSLTAYGGRAADTGIHSRLRSDTDSILQRIFRTPEAYYRAAEQRRADELKSLSFGSRLIEDAGNDPFYLQSDLTLTLDQSAVDPALLNIISSAAGMDFGWLQSLGLSVTSGREGDLTRSQVMLRLNDTDIAHLDALFDPSSMNAYVGVPELNPSYILLDLKEMAERIPGASLNTYRMNTMFSRGTPDTRLIKDIFTRYLDLVLSNIDRVAVKDGTVSAGGITNSCSVAKVSFEGEDILRIVRACLKAAAEDSQVEDLAYQFMSMGSMYSGSAGYFHNAYTEWIRDTLSELDEVSPEDITESLQMTVYIDRGGKILGRSLEVRDDGELKALLSYVITRDGERLGLEASFGAYDSYSYSDRYRESRNELTISGAGNYTDDGRLSGSFLINYYLYENWNGRVDKIDLPLVTAYVDGTLDKGGFLGDVVLTPCRQLLDLVEEEFDGAPDAVIKFVRSLTMTLSNRSTDSKIDWTAALRSNGRTFLTLEQTAFEIDGMDMTPPTELTDQDTWVDSMGVASLANIIIRLRSAGVPVELLNSLLR